MEGTEVKTHPKEFDEAKIGKVEPGQLRIFVGIVSGALYDFVAHLVAAGHDPVDLQNQLKKFAKKRELDLDTTDPRFWDSGVEANLEFEAYKRKNPSSYVLKD